MLRKELAQLKRDPRMRVIMVVPPIIMLVVFGYAIETDVKDIRLAVINESPDQTSRDFIRNFSGSEYFSLAYYQFNNRNLDDLLHQGKADAILNIPVNFSASLKSGKKVAVQVLLDGSDSNRSSVISAYIQQVISGYIAQNSTAKVKAAIQQRAMPANLPRIHLQSRFFFNPELQSKNFYLPGIIGLLIALTTIMLTSMSIVRERETGTIEQINVSPLHPMEYIIGKMIPFGIVATGQILVVSLGTILWFKVPLNGSFLFLIFTGIAFILSTLSVGLFISTVSGTQQQAMLTSFLFFLPAILLSGFIFPVYAMPEIIQWVTYLNPIRYYTEIARGIFLKGNGIVVLWPQTAALLSLGSLLLFFSVLRFQKRAK